MNTTRAIILATALLGLAACGSSSDANSESEPASPAAPSEAGPLDEPARTTEEVNAEFAAALVDAGLETCDVTAGNRSTDYLIAPCEDEAAERYTSGGHVVIYVYRDVAGQQDDLATRNADLGLKGWTWGTATVSLLDQNPDPEVVAKLNAMMDSLGATVEYDSTPAP